MKKKKTFIIIAVVILITVVVAGSVLLLRGRKMILETGEKVTKVVILNGNNGKITELSDGIDELCNLLSNTKVKKVSKQDTSGWLYKIDVYHNEDVVDSVTMISNETCLVSDNRYSIDAKKGDSILSLIEELENEVQ